MRYRNRGRWTTLLVSVTCVAGLGLFATAATGSATPAVAFAQTGHWVVNRAESAVVHVDGGTGRADARVALPADAGEPLFALQGATQGFVVARDRISVFGRSTLTVDSTIPVDHTEVPVGIETVGGPYLVYREAGTIVRLAVPPVSLPIGGSVDRPVWTDDGTVWLHRPDDGAFCALRDGADTLDCSATTAPGEPGALTVTSDLPAYLATRPDAIEVLTTLDAPVGVGTDVPEPALVADRDTVGRLPAVDPAANRLLLADSAGVPDGRAGGAPVTVDLGPGRFASPVAAGGVVAVLDESTNRLSTFDGTGNRLGIHDLPPGAPPTLTRGGDGRIYVDDADGAATHVVGSDGSVTSVATGEVSIGLVASAPPADWSRPVVPGLGGEPRVVPVTGTPPANGGPVGGPVGGPAPRPEGPVEVTPLPAPAGVTARIEGASAVVGWAPVDGGAEAVRYTVRSSDGDTRTVTATTATFDDVPVGRPLTFRVSAATDTRTGPESAPTPAVTRVGPAGPPTGLTAEITRPSGVQSEWTTTWEAPADLGGGEFVHYVVTTANGMERTTATTRDAAFRPNCAPSPIEVRAVTRGPSGELIDGESAQYVVGNEQDCTIGSILTANVQEGRVWQVWRQFSGVGGAEASCSLYVNGEVRLTRTCRMSQVPNQLLTTLDLDYDTTYTLELRIEAPTPGSRATVSDPLVFTTGPAPAGGGN